MHVVAHRPQIARAAAVHDQRFVTSAEHMPKEFVPAIEPRRVGAQEPAHPGDKVGRRRLDDQMKMIQHQAIRMHLPARLGAGLVQGGHEPLAVKVIVEDRLAPVATVHHMINRSGVFDA